MRSRKPSASDAVLEPRSIGDLRRPEGRVFHKMPALQNFLVGIERKQQEACKERKRQRQLQNRAMPLHVLDDARHDGTI